MVQQHTLSKGGSCLCLWLCIECCVSLQKEKEKRETRWADLIDRVACVVGGLHARHHLGLLPDPEDQVPLRSAPLGCQEAAVRTEGHAGDLLHQVQHGVQEQVEAYLLTT